MADDQGSPPAHFDESQDSPVPQEESSPLPPMHTPILNQPRAAIPVAENPFIHFEDIDLTFPMNDKSTSEKNKKKYKRGRAMSRSDPFISLAEAYLNENSVLTTH